MESTQTTDSGGRTAEFSCCFEVIVGSEVVADTRNVCRERARPWSASAGARDRDIAFASSRGMERPTSRERERPWAEKNRTSGRTNAGEGMKFFPSWLSLRACLRSPMKCISLHLALHQTGQMRQEVRFFFPCACLSAHSIRDVCSIQQSLLMRESPLCVEGI